MQKVTFILTLLLIAGISNAGAQTPDVTTISSLKLTEGKNTVRLPDGSGSFEFVKRGDTFSDVVFIRRGTTNNLKQIGLAAKNTNGKLPTPCQYPIPDACFGIPNSSEVAMCFCKPTNLSGGEYTVTFVKAVLYGRKADDDRRQDY
ncbi:hypothetical protein HB364_30215 [Pseudoflavitalea sp. X16]|uniref:hypothetical protein n=1 Tax=Paraflavitalea devenefica TaxID=2716334 RepID=UPI00142186DA|nr:hypothetical protein [Paraflavitalea devenefica]NII29394.1 hypothetical protein [Paraflavitalea devenefica]